MAKSAALAALLCLPSSGYAQWQAIKLHTPELDSSVVLAVGDGCQGGRIAILNPFFAPPVLWQTAPGPTAYLTPPGGTGGQVLGIHGNTQVGWWDQGAVLWHGTASSYVNLQPAGARASYAHAVWGDVQAGDVTRPGQEQHAGFWRGTAESWVDLHPPAFFNSIAYATDGTHVGGEIRDNFSERAALWDTTTLQMRQMMPAGAIASSIRAMAPGQQAGYFVDAQGVHAAIWSGTPESVIDLNPFPSPLGGRLFGTNGSIQVGEAAVPGATGTHAAIWFGSASTFIDLHQFLPPGYTRSAAYGVFEKDGVIVVGGVAGTLSTNNAFLWVLPPPGVLPVLVLGGVVAARRRRR